MTRPPSEEPPYLHGFDPKPIAASMEPLGKPLRYPIWTENKATLIEAYLRLFVYVTHHGTYLDLFAGPQEAECPGMWAAQLVLESRPRWLQHIHLFEKSKRGVALLEKLKAAQPPRAKKEPRREIKIYRGDANVRILELLREGTIRQKEAVFCLLDQRTFECRWATVRALASYKSPGHHKIELFYFLANGWLHRAFSAQKDRGALTQWWGSDDWTALRKIAGLDRAARFCARFRDELGYRSAKPYEIRARESGGRIMYYMIHATDHPEAPDLMIRAYHKAVTPNRATQTNFEWNGA